MKRILAAINIDCNEFTCGNCEQSDLGYCHLFGELCKKNDDGMFERLRYCHNREVEA